MRAPASYNSHPSPRQTHPLRLVIPQLKCLGSGPTYEKGRQPGACGIPSPPPPAPAPQTSALGKPGAYGGASSWGQGSGGRRSPSCSQSGRGAWWDVETGVHAQAGPGVDGLSLAWPGRGQRRQRARAKGPPSQALWRLVSWEAESAPSSQRGEAGRPGARPHPHHTAWGLWFWEIQVSSRAQGQILGTSSFLPQSWGRPGLPASGGWP